MTAQRGHRYGQDAQRIQVHRLPLDPKARRQRRVQALWRIQDNEGNNDPAGAPIEPGD